MKKRSLSNNVSLVDIQKQENAYQKKIYMDTNVIDVENVKNVVDMMQNVESQLHQKYDEQKDGMLRSIEI